jgi:DNA replication protein DnaC
VEADPNCPHCDGTGWKQVVRDGVVAVERCECREESRQQALLANARIPERFRQASFDNFVLPNKQENPIANDKLARAMVTAKSYVREYPSPPKLGIMFQGATGVGKTHLACAVLRELAERGFECLFFDYQALLERIRQSYDASAGSGGQREYHKALEAEVVLLDDLGSHRPSEWVEDTVTAIINHRYNAGKALIVTTNLPDPELGDQTTRKDPVSGHYHVRDTLGDRIGSRARSRVYEMCHVVKMDTHDYRLQKLRR